MHEILCFAGQHVSWKMGKLVRRTGARQSRVSSDHSLIGRVVERTVQASFLKLQLSEAEGSLAQKLRFHIFHLHFLREVSHQSFVFTSSTFTFWGRPRTKASFSQLPLSLFEGCLAPKLPFHIFHFHFLREASHQSFVFTFSTFTFWGRSCTKASFLHLPLSVCEGGLAPKLRFHIFHFHFLRGVSHQSFVFTFSTFTFRGRPCTKASFSHLPLPLLLFEGSLARNALR